MMIMTNHEIIPTDQYQSTSNEDDCCVESAQSAREEEVEEVTLCPKRSHKNPSNYNPQTGKSYAQKTIETTGVAKTEMFKSSRAFLKDAKLC